MRIVLRFLCALVVLGLFSQTGVAQGMITAIHGKTEVQAEGKEAQRSREYIDYFSEAPQILLAVKDSIKSHMPAWTAKEVLSLKLGQWIALLAVFLIAFVLAPFLSYSIFLIVTNWFKKRGLKVDMELWQRARFPIRIFGAAVVWTYGLMLLELGASSQRTLVQLGVVLLVFSVVWFFYRFIDVAFIFVEELSKRSASKFDDIIVPLARATIKVIVIVLGVFFVGKSVGINLTGLLTGLGIGGLAFAFAAKDILANLFGSLTVLLDRPFEIGDWVSIGDIEGTVEAVGLRSTKIRTFYDSLISVPNSVLTSTSVNNYGKRRYRRYSAKIGLQYDTAAEKIESFCEGVRQIIIKHPHTRKDNFHVYFNGFNESSLDIMLYVFWSVPDWATELNEKHRLHMDILRLGRRLNVEFAFPTRTVHLFNEDKYDPQADLPEKPLEWASKKADEVISKPFTPKNPRSKIEDIKTE